MVAQISGESEINSVQTPEGVIRAQLAELQTQLDRLLLQYTDEYPDVVRVRHQIEDLKSQLAREQQRVAAARDAGAPRALDQAAQFNPLYQQLRSHLAELRQNTAATQSRMDASESMLGQELDRSRRVAASESALAELTRDYEVNRDIYQDLLKRRENARVSMNLDEEKRGLTFRIQDPAVMPLRPSGLRFMHFALAALALGIAIPIGFVFGLTRYDPRIRSSMQLEQLGIPVLAAVPFYATRGDRNKERMRLAVILLLLAGVAAAYGLTYWLKLTLSALN
jgi:polysaccharide chain length determinant protein (PEP-CTERM system associated)